MEAGWRTVEVYMLSTSTAYEVRDHAYSVIRVIAGDAGEFVEQIKIGRSVHQADGWSKWHAHYLPGLPGVFRDRPVEST